MLKKLFLVFFTLVTLFSCEVPVHEEYDLYGDGIENPNANGQFKMKINGVNWTSQTAYALVLADRIAIFAFESSPTGKNASLSIRFVEGNQTLDDDSDIDFFNQFVYQPNISEMTSYSCPDNWEYPTAIGSVNVSSINTTTKKISGTFSGKAYNDDGEFVNITDGIFTNVSYEDQ